FRPPPSPNLTRRARDGLGKRIRRRQSAQLNFFLPELDDAGRVIEQDLDRREQLIGAERLAEHDRPAESGWQSLSAVSGHECERTIFPCQQGRKLIDRLANEIDVEQNRVAV